LHFHRRLAAEVLSRRETVKNLLPFGIKGGARLAVEGFVGAFGSDRSLAAGTTAFAHAVAFRKVRLTFAGALSAGVLGVLEALQGIAHVLEIFVGEIHVLEVVG